MSDNATGKRWSESEFLAVKYTESITLPVQEQPLRYEERFALVQNILFVLPPGGFVFTLRCPKMRALCIHLTFKQMACNIHCVH